MRIAAERLGTTSLTTRETITTPSGEVAAEAVVVTVRWDEDRHQPVPFTPAGGKGMNLAIQDAIELGGGLAERFGPGRDGARLAAYSATRLPAIWRAQAFSDWFLRIILAGGGDAGLGRDAGLGGESVAGGPYGFGRGLREGWVSALASDPLLARWFAHAYAGVDP